MASVRARKRKAAPAPKRPAARRNAPKRSTAPRKVASRPGRVVVDGLNCAIVNRDQMLRMREGGIGAINLTIVRPWDGYETSMAKLARTLDTIEANGDLVRIARSVKEVREIAATGRIAVVMGAQNSMFVENDIDLLKICQRFGFRILQPTYMEQNQLGSGVLAERDGGLTERGRRWVEEMNRLRLLIDLSHVGHQTARDAAAASKQPVIVSHANPLTLCKSPRNIPDDLIKQVAAKGGVLGCTQWPPMVRHERRPTLDDVADVVRYVVDMVGVDHVGFSSDLSEAVYTPETWAKSFGPKGMYPTVTGVMGPWFTFETRTTEGFESLRFMPRVADALRRKGFKASEIDKIRGGNFLRVYREVWGE